MIKKESRRGFLNMKIANQMHGFPPETKFEQSSMEGKTKARLWYENNSHRCKTSWINTGAHHHKTKLSPSSHLPGQILTTSVIFCDAISCDRGHWSVITCSRHVTDVCQCSEYGGHLLPTYYHLLLALQKVPDTYTKAVS